MSDMACMTRDGLEAAEVRRTRNEHCRLGGLPGMDERTAVICGSRNRMLGEKLELVRDMVFGRRGILKRAARMIENAWAMLWAVGHCWVEIGEGLGLWERVHDDETER